MARALLRDHRACPTHGPEREGADASREELGAAAHRLKLRAAHVEAEASVAFALRPAATNLHTAAHRSAYA